MIRLREISRRLLPLLDVTMLTLGFLLMITSQMVMRSEYAAAEETRRADEARSDNERTLDALLESELSLTIRVKNDSVGKVDLLVGGKLVRVAVIDSELEKAIARDFPTARLFILDDPYRSLIHRRAEDFRAQLKNRNGLVIYVGPAGDETKAKR